MTFVPEKDAEEAGLVLFRDKENFFRFVIRKSDAKQLLRLIQSKYKAVSETECKNQDIFLKISSNDVYMTFSYSYNGEEWKILSENVDGRLPGSSVLGRFTGTFVGNYASSNKNISNNSVIFDWFEYESLK